MKSSLVIESGLIDDDGRLWLPQERIKDFCREHPGERALIKVEAIGRHATYATFRYYFGYVVPTLRLALAKKGTLKTEKETHDYFWDIYPGEHDRTQDIREAPSWQVSAYIDWLKRIGAEWLSVYVEDSKII